MQIQITKKWKVRFKSGKLKYHHKISLGEVIAIIVDTAILIAIFSVG